MENQGQSSDYKFDSVELFGMIVPVLFAIMTIAIIIMASPKSDAQETEKAQASVSHQSPRSF